MKIYFETENTNPAVMNHVMNARNLNSTDEKIKAISELIAEYGYHDVFDAVISTAGAETEKCLEGMSRFLMETIYDQYEDFIRVMFEKQEY